jgi:hypothetical protein
MKNMHATRSGPGRRPQRETSQLNNERDIHKHLRGFPGAKIKRQAAQHLIGRRHVA